MADTGLTEVVQELAGPEMRVDTMREIQPVIVRRHES